jgi:UPF0755 protein
MKKLFLHPKKWSRKILIILILLILVFISVGAIRMVYNDNLQSLSSSQEIVKVTIPVGSSLKEVAQMLKEKNVIKSPWAFERYVRNRNGADKIKAGTYELSPSQDVQEIVAVITAGKVASNLVTILPGRRLDQIKKTFSNAGYSKDEIDKAFNPESYKNHPALADKPPGVSLEGYLYPESFQKTADTKPEVIIEASLDEMQKRLTPQLRDAFVKQGLNVHQAVILGSIVEREVSRSSDRPIVAQVFLKRLRQGMLLQSDPTAFYGSAIAGQPASLKYDSPYNTYLYQGLPVGPISNVTGDSLQAVASPDNTDYLYFVAGDDGTTHYSKTKEDHEANIERYCKKLCNQVQ